VNDSEAVYDREFVTDRDADPLPDTDCVCVFVDEPLPLDENVSLRDVESDAETVCEPESDADRETLSLTDTE